MNQLLWLKYIAFCLLIYIAAQNDNHAPRLYSKVRNYKNTTITTHVDSYHDDYMRKIDIVDPAAHWDTAWSVE